MESGIFVLTATTELWSFKMPILARRKLLLVTALVVCVNVLDLFTTYLASPNLVYEWNALERVFGLGWIGLICAKMIGAWMAYLGYSYYLAHRDDCYPSDADAKPSVFLHAMIFGKPNDQPDKLRGSELRALGVGVGYFWTGIQWLVLWVALDNILLYWNIVNPIRRASESEYHAMQSLIVGMSVLYRFYFVNYRRYLLLNRNRQVAVPSDFAEASVPSPVK